MNATAPLLWYGIAILIAMGSAIVIPFMRGKAELITGWTVFLLGIAMYVGVGSCEAATSAFAWRSMTFEASKSQVNWYMAATTLFLVTLFACYYYNPIPKWLTARTLRNWPPFNVTTVMYVIVFGAAVMAASFALSSSTFLGPVLRNLSHKAAVFAVVFSFALWYRNKVNGIYLALAIGVFLSACLFAMLAYTGRRLLLSMAAGPILCVYFMTLRNWRPTRTMGALAIGTLAVFVAGLFYSSFRHYDKRGGRQERTASGIVDQVKQLDTGEVVGNFLESNMLRYISQYAVFYALIVDDLVESNQITVQPLNTLKFIVSYPVPRRLWPNKPKTIGNQISTDILRVSRSVSWGVSIAGHGAYEGGMGVLMLYAFLAAFGLRFLSDPISAQPNNPYLIAILASAAPHVLAWPRGDIAIMSVETIECFVYAIALGVGGRILFGVDRSAQQPPRHLASQPYGQRTLSR